jgi:hypothetical protein
MSEGMGMRFAFFGPLQLMAMGVGDGGLRDFSQKLDHFPTKLFVLLPIWTHH